MEWSENHLTTPDYIFLASVFLMAIGGWVLWIMAIGLGTKHQTPSPPVNQSTIDGVGIFIGVTFLINGIITVVVLSVLLIKKIIDDDWCGQSSPKMDSENWDDEQQ
jgi:hypothetical protein